tara:strand:- start:96 stop:437 length:342 start_codon:yes stop_codon:yes gene_type:complete
MPFALVPEGFELKKVTKLQKQAVDKYYRSNSINTFLANPQSIIFISGIVATYLGTKAAADVLADLKDKGIAITESAKDSITETLTKKRDVGAPVGISIEDIIEEGLSRLNPFD